MSSRLLALLLVIGLFGALTSVALMDVGYLGIFGIAVAAGAADGRADGTADGWPGPPLSRISIARAAGVSIVTAAAVSAPGRETVGVDSPGSDSHISTTTRRYGNARMMATVASGTRRRT